MPIGYWIKQADKVLTKGIDDIHLEEQLTRTGWQVLNLVHDSGVILKSSLIRMMEPLAGPREIDDILCKLVAEERLNISPHNMLSLSGKGRLLHSTSLEVQQQFRSRAMRGISEEEYDVTIKTLKRIVENIGLGG